MAEAVTLCCAAGPERVTWTRTKAEVKWVLVWANSKANDTEGKAMLLPLTPGWEPDGAASGT